MTLLPKEGVIRCVFQWKKWSRDKSFTLCIIVGPGLWNLQGQFYSSSFELNAAPLNHRLPLKSLPSSWLANFFLPLTTTGKVKAHICKLLPTARFINSKRKMHIRYTKRPVGRGIKTVFRKDFLCTSGYSWYAGNLFWPDPSLFSCPGWLHLEYPIWKQKDKIY